MGELHFGESPWIACIQKVVPTVMLFYYYYCVINLMVEQLFNMMKLENML